MLPVLDEPQLVDVVAKPRVGPDIRAFGVPGIGHVPVDPAFAFGDVVGEFEKQRRQVLKIAGLSVEPVDHHPPGFAHT